MATKRTTDSKRWWVTSLVIDTTLVALNTAAAVGTCVLYKKGKIEDKGKFICGVGAGANIGIGVAGVSGIVRDIRRIRLINKKAKKDGCNANEVSAHTEIVIEHEPETESVESTKVTESKIGFKADC